MTFDVDRPRAVAAGDLGAPLVDEIEDDASQVDVTLVFRHAGATTVVPGGSRAPSRGARSWSASRALISGPGPIGSGGTREPSTASIWAGTGRPPARPHRTPTTPAASSAPRTRRSTSGRRRSSRCSSCPTRRRSTGSRSARGARRLGRGAPPGQRAPRQRAPGVPLPAPRVRPERARRAARALRRMGVHARRLGAAHAGRAHPRARDSAPRRGAARQPRPRGTHARAQLDEAFAAFVFEELLPWARARLGAPGDGETAVVAGSSLGGLTAMSLAHARPDVFGNVVSLSGSLQLPEGRALISRLAKETGTAPACSWPREPWRRASGRDGARLRFCTRTSTCATFSWPGAATSATSSSRAATTTSGGGDARRGALAAARLRACGTRS